MGDLCWGLWEKGQASVRQDCVFAWESSANDFAHRPTPPNLDWLPGMSASLLNVSLLNENTDHVCVRFVQHPHNVRDGKFVIGEEITDRDLSLCDLVNGI